MSEEITIKPGSLTNRYFKELFDRRRLFYFIAWRDILVRYKQASLGFVWALLRPFLGMFLFVVIFSKVANLPSDGVSYPLFVMAAMLPWQYFASTLQSASTSLPNNSVLITKVFFPRIVLPLSSVLVNLIDALIGYAVFLPWLFLSGGYSCEGLWLAPLLFLQTILLCTGISFWVSALGAKWRDLIIATPYLTQLSLFLSPVGYASNLFPEKWRFFYQLNPFVGLIDGFRYAFFYLETPSMWEAIAVSFGVTSFLVVTGGIYFFKMERRLADIL